jgi:TPR repeat protein
LALKHLSGKGVNQDIEKCVYYLKEAVKGKNPHAEYQLGNLYEYGKGTTLLFKGATVLNVLGVQKNIGEAARLYKLSSSHGDCNAQYRLGLIRQNGSIIVNYSYE